MIKNNLKKNLGLNKTQNLSSLNLILNYYNKISHYIYKKKYSTDELIGKLRSMGIGEGSNIFIHSSWDAFFNYSETEDDLVIALLKLIGPNGTLAMPAYPLIRKNKPFNVQRTVTKAGILAEAFRKYPGVQRSINVEHSVCAIGPLSDYLLSEHQLSIISTDKKSPYYKICKQGDFKVISFGLTFNFIGTIIHVPTATMYDSIDYFRNMFDFEHKYYFNYLDNNMNIKTYFNYNISSKVSRRTDYFYSWYFIKKYFSKSLYKNSKISNLTISIYDAKQTYNTLAELAKNNKFIYLTPRP